MGTIDAKYPCLTCKQTRKECPGHFGRIELAKKVYYPHLITTIIRIMQCVCYNCSELLDQSAVKYKKVEVTKRLTSVHNICKKHKKCSKCNLLQPKFKRENLKLIREFSNIDPDTKVKETKTEVIFPEKCEEFLSSIDPEIFTLMGLDPKKISHESGSGLVCTVLPVGPPSIRPSVYNGYLRSEGDLTYKLIETIKANENLKKKIDQTNEQISELKKNMNSISIFLIEDELKDGLTPEEIKEYKKIKKENEKTEEEIDKKNSIIHDYYELLQYHVFTLIDNSIPYIPAAQQRSGRPLKSIKDRLQGKQGRVRGNLMGKRVDFSARSVIDGDPLISINEIGVPIEIAMNLTYPEIINRYNEVWLKSLVENGPSNHPGANFVVLKRNNRDIRTNLEYNKKIIYYEFETDIEDWVETRDLKTEEATPEEERWIVLRKGDIVERHMCDPNGVHNGDYVAFNRQPSLHKMNIMGHRARIFPNKCFRLNVCVTSPYNADFDKLSVENMGA
jgi:DNA-directed RNA polymerase II subunit RPB1